MMTRSWLALALAIPMAGCSLLVDTDPFQTPRDGGTPPQGDAGSDAGPDGDTPDAEVPTTPVVRITPAEPVTTDDLRLEIETESVDPLDAGPVTYRIEWLRDGSDAGIEEETVPASDTAKAQVWTVRVTPTSADGARTGEPGTATVTIGNLPPSLSYVGLSHYRPIEGETLETFTGPITDPDDDLTRYVYTWFADGEPIEGEAGPRLVLDSVTAGARIKVQVTPRDDEDLDGPPIETGEAIVVEDTIRWRQLAPDRFYDARGVILYDPPNRRALVFYHVDEEEPRALHVWEYALEPLGGRWVELHPSGDPIRLVGARPILDERNRRILFLGQYEGETLTSRVVSFDLSVRGAERWEELSPTGDAPTLRQFESFAYDAERQQVLLYGGMAEGGTEAVNELHTLDVSRPGFEAWTRVPFSGTGVLGATIVVDAERDRALFLGGLVFGTGGVPSLLDSIYTLDLTAPDEGLALASARLPTGLALTTTLVDPERDRAILAWGLESFGAPAPSVRALDLESLAVTDLAPTGGTPVPGVMGFMFLDPHEPGRVIVHAGPPAADGDGSTRRFDLYEMDAETTAFTALHRFGVDAPHALVGASGGPRESGLFLVGGQNGRGGGATTERMWVFNRRTGWTSIALTPDAVTGGTPEPRYGAGAWGSFNSLRYFGGDNGAAPVSATAWTLENVGFADPQWVEHTLASGSPAPTPREGPTVMQPDCGSGPLAVFGGTSETGNELDDMWVLLCSGSDLRGCTWVERTFTTAPPARAYATAGRAGSDVLLFGGISGASARGDLWALDDCSSPAVWSPVAVSGTGPSRWGHSMTRREDTVSGVVRWVIFGGMTGRDSNTASAEAWMLVREAGAYRWERVEVASGPNDAVIDPRGRHVAAWESDETVPRLLVYGGESRGYPRSDVWELRFPSP